MGIDSYEELQSHVGHTIECVGYADGRNVALECLDCSTVLMDFDRESTPKAVSALFRATPTSTPPEGLTDAQEAAYELIEAYTTWLPRWKDNELMTRMVIRMERFIEMVKEGRFD